MTDPDPLPLQGLLGIQTAIFMNYVIFVPNKSHEVTFGLHFVQIKSIFFQWGCVFRQRDMFEK